MELGRAARPPRHGLDAPASSSGPPRGNDLAHGCRPSPPLPVAPLNLARTAPDGVSPVALSLKLCCTPTRRPTVIASSSQRAAASCSECLSSLNAMNVSCSECLSTLPASAAAPAFAATACASCPCHDCLRSVRPPRQLCPPRRPPQRPPASAASPTPATAAPASAVTARPRLLACHDRQPAPAPVCKAAAGET